MKEKTGVWGICLKRECRDTSLPGFGVSPNKNFPQDWGNKGVEPEQSEGSDLGYTPRVRAIRPSALGRKDSYV